MASSRRAEALTGAMHMAVIPARILNSSVGATLLRSSASSYLFLRRHRSHRKSISSSMLRLNPLWAGRLAALILRYGDQPWESSAPAWRIARIEPRILAMFTPICSVPSRLPGSASQLAESTP